jgi:preprotein translocase subunit SecY
MFEKLRVVFAIPELRKKILFTLGLLLIYRVGWQINLPVVDSAKIASAMSGTGILGLMNQVSVFSASSLNQFTIFGLGIMPYISASIIFQLLGTVWPPLERLQKEGEAGRKKINEYTRYATVILCFAQSWFYLGLLTSRGLANQTMFADGHITFSWQLVTVMVMTTGTVFLMWLGEQIDEFGIGNGISLLIMAGILANMPGAFKNLYDNTQMELGSGGQGKFGPETILSLLALFLAIVAGVVFITLGQRRIPIQSAKHVRGRRVMGGSRDYLPLRVNQANVMPIIFGSSLLLFPGMLFHQLATRLEWGHDLWQGLAEAFSRGQSFLYYIFFIALIYFFCYFWTAITFNPKDMADNLKNFGTFIPGYRPGSPTANYLEKVMVRITYVGAAFLALVAVLPAVIAQFFGVSQTISQYFGGTSLLIAVSVAFDLVQKIDSHLVMRNYKGLMER